MEDYKGDYYGWLTTTAQALADGRTVIMNLAQVAEELRDRAPSHPKPLSAHSGSSAEHEVPAR